MRNQTHLVAFLLAGFVAACVLPATIFADESGVDAVVEKALPYLHREGVAWIEKRGCVSCHQVPFMLWSLSAAKRHGFAVDEAELDRWQEWSTQVTSFVKPEQNETVDQDKTMSSNIDTMSALLLAIEDESTDDEVPTWRTRFSDALAANQNKDGTWKSCGQLPMQKRPAKETNQVTAMWTLLALTYPKPPDVDFDAAYKFIDEGGEATSTEWWVARLLLAHQQNDDRAAIFRDALVDRQNDDGGWGWLCDDPSDAMATGMAIYALRGTDSGSDVQHSTIERAKQFLTTTQKPDGFWAVHGTKKATRDKPTATANYWGTAWAVIGLLETR